MSEPRYLTRQSKPKRLRDYRKGFDKTAEHMSSPDGCHEDCPACAAEDEFDEAMAWRLDVGAECNMLLDHAVACEVASMGFGASADFAKALRSIVARVAAFEDLELDTKEKEIL
jgi:hypothetical protein